MRNKVENVEGKKNQEEEELGRENGRRKRTDNKTKKWRYKNMETRTWKATMEEAMKWIIRAYGGRREQRRVDRKIMKGTRKRTKTQRRQYK